MGRCIQTVGYNRTVSRANQVLSTESINRKDKKIVSWLRQPFVEITKKSDMFTHTIGPLLFPEQIDFL